MKPLFKNILLRIEKEKKSEETFEDIFSKPEKEEKKRAEATLVGFAHDCEDEVHTLMDKKVLWNGKYLVTVEETEDYKVHLAPETSLIAML